MTRLRAVLSLNRDSGLLKDLVTNTWHYEDVGGGPDYAEILNALDEFYTSDINGAATALDRHFSNTFSGTGLLRVYNLADPSPRPVRFESAFSITPSGNSLPDFCAMTLSFHAALTAGTQPGRRRNRVYLGPWGTDQVGLNGAPNVNVLTRIRLAAARLLARSNAHATTHWRVYSGTDDLMLPIVGGWTKNQWDMIQRRRLSPAAKTLW